MFCGHLRGLKSIKLTPTDKQCVAALLVKRYAVHGVGMALKTHKVTVCGE